MFMIYIDVCLCVVCSKYTVVLKEWWRMIHALYSWTTAALEDPCEMAGRALEPR
jgi:hypothetical protein